MTPELWTAIVVALIAFFGAVTGALLIYAVQSRRAKHQDTNDDASTAQISLNMAQQAIRMAEESANQNKLILDRLAGMHRLTVDFDIRELLESGKAIVKFGQIEALKMEPEKVDA